MKDSPAPRPAPLSVSRFTRYASRSGSGGFTLIEVLISSVMIGVMGLALGALFAAGIQLWRRISFESPSELAALALSEMIERREAARVFTPLKLEEAPPGELLFAGLVRTPSGGRIIGEIRYWTDSGALLRRERTYAEVISDEEGATTEICPSVERLEVEDLYFNATDGRYQTDPIVLGEQSEEITPRPDAVRITLRYKTPDGNSRSLERIFRV